jgi:hypothetical protein
MGVVGVVVEMEPVVFVVVVGAASVEVGNFHNYHTDPLILKKVQVGIRMFDTEAFSVVVSVVFAVLLAEALDNPGRNLVRIHNHAYYILVPVS